MPQKVITLGDELMRKNSENISKRSKEDLTKVTFKELKQRVMKSK